MQGWLNILKPLTRNIGRGLCRSNNETVSSRQEDSQAENEVEAVEASNSAARDGVLNWVKVYTCMITEGKELSQSRSNLHLKYYFANAMKAGKRMMKFFKRKANKLASKLKGKTKPLLRLSKKLAGSRFCRAKSECKKWHSLLTAALGNQEILPESCQTFTRERGLVQIKGDPNERIGTIDLSSLDMGTASRKVTLVKSSSGELAFSVRNDLMSEVVSKVTLGTSVPKDYEAISGSWSNLIQTLEARSRQCKVDKVGVFNMQAPEVFFCVSYLFGILLFYVITKNNPGKALVKPAFLSFQWFSMVISLLRQWFALRPGSRRMASRCLSDFLGRWSSLAAQL